MRVGSVCAHPTYNDKNPPSGVFLIPINNIPFLKSILHLPICSHINRGHPNHIKHVWYLGFKSGWWRLYDYVSTLTIVNARPQNSCCMAPLDSEDGGNCFMTFCSNTTVCMCRKHITTVRRKRSAGVKSPQFWTYRVSAQSC